MSLTEETDDKGRVPIHVQEARRTPHDRDTCTRENCGRCHPPAPGPAKAPTIKPNPHDADTPPAPPDRTVRSIGLARHGTPHEIAKRLRELARALDDEGTDAIDDVSTLADRAYPHATLGDGGSRGTDSTSVQERTVIASPERWAGADARYARDLAVIEKLAIDLKGQTHDIRHHAQLIDPTPVGTGECKGCARTVRPNEDKPGNRLRSGLCPSCYRAWNRYRSGGGTDIRSEWATKRRESYSERDAHGILVRIHTPEPDHDIDLSTEQWTDPEVTIGDAGAEDATTTTAGQ